MRSYFFVFTHLLTIFARAAALASYAVSFSEVKFVFLHFLGMSNAEAIGAAILGLYLLAALAFLPEIIDWFATKSRPGYATGSTDWDATNDDKGKSRVGNEFDWMIPGTIDYFRYHGTDH